MKWNIVFIIVLIFIIIFTGWLVIIKAKAATTPISMQPIPAWVDWVILFMVIAFCGIVTWWMTYKGETK